MPDSAHRGAVDINDIRYHDQKKSEFGNEKVKMCAMFLELTGCFSERTTFIVYWKLGVFFLINDLRGTILQNYFKITLCLSSYLLSAMFYHKGYKWSWGNNIERGAWSHERLMHSAVRNSYGRLWPFFFCLLHINALSLRKGAFPSNCALTSKPVYNTVSTWKKKNKPQCFCFANLFIMEFLLL